MKKKDQRINIRVSQEMKDRLKEKAGDGGITDYIEELIESDLGKPIENSLSAEKFNVESATSEYQKKLELGKSLVSKYKPHPAQVKFYESAEAENKLELDMEEKQSSPERHWVQDEDVPEENVSQSRVVGRHKK